MSENHITPHHEKGERVEGLGRSLQNLGRRGGGAEGGGARPTKLAKPGQ